MSAGEVKKVSMMTTDMLPVSANKKLFIMISLLTAVISVFYFIASIILMIIGAIRNRKKAVAHIQ